MLPELRDADVGAVLEPLVGVAAELLVGGGEVVCVGSAGAGITGGGVVAAAGSDAG